MKQKLIWLYSFTLVLFLGVNEAQPAACCGGGFAAPSIITSDDKAQLTSSYASTEVVVDNINAQGIWRKWDTHQQIQTYKLDGAHIFWDRYQSGFSIPVIERRQESLNYSGLGDISTSIGYEYLPDWDYNPFRPKGIGFIQLTLPTGKSRTESEVGGLDSRGNGFWALGLGTFLTKNWTRFDSFLSTEVHRSFGKNISNSQLTAELKPGYGGNLAMGLGYNIKNYRFGSSVTWTYEDAIKIISNSNASSNGSIERFATGVLNASFMANDEWSGTVSYSDQTLFGSPVNTSLGRGFSFQLQKRWGR